MAQTGFTPILIYSSSTGGNAPAVGNLTNSTLGSELAINITDGKLFYKDNANAIQVIGWKVVPATAGGTGQTSYTQGDLLYATSSTTLGRLADVATGNALISGGVGGDPVWGKIGLTTHVSGVLPTANGGTNLSSFTANGVMYASSTSALATSSNLTFDGTNLTSANAVFTPRIGTATSAALNFAINNSNVAAIDTSGNWFVGYTSGTGGGKLNVNGRIVSESAGSDSFSGTYYFNGTGGASNIQMGASGGIAFWTFSGGWGERARVFTSGGFSIGSTTDPGAGNLSLGTGNLVIGTSGKGIDFSATPGTGTSELLADYEEGTFTPSITGGATGVSYTTQSGTYTKVGRLVTFRLNLVMSAATANGTAFKVGGLPFTVGIQGGAGFAYDNGAWTGSATTNMPMAFVGAGGTEITFFQGNGGQVVGTDLVSIAADNFYLYGEYMV